MVDAPITCKLLSHSMACHPPAVNKKKKISEKEKQLSKVKNDLKKAESNAL